MGESMEGPTFEVGQADTAWRDPWRASRQRPRHHILPRCHHQEIFPHEQQSFNSFSPSRDPDALFLHPTMDYSQSLIPPIDHPP